jgi:hypothetical protein
LEASLRAFASVANVRAMKLKGIFIGVVTILVVLFLAGFGKYSFEKTILSDYTYLIAINVELLEESNADNQTLKIINILELLIAKHAVVTESFSHSIFAGPKETGLRKRSMKAVSEKIIKTLTLKNIDTPILIKLIADEL